MNDECNFFHNLTIVGFYDMILGLLSHKQELTTKAQRHEEKKVNRKDKI